MHFLPVSSPQTCANSQRCDLVTHELTRTLLPQLVQFSPYCLLSSGFTILLNTLSSIRIPKPKASLKSAANRLTVHLVRLHGQGEARHSHHPL